MAGIFSEKGLPRELAYLPLVESGFNPHAYSHRRAAGLWQFMPRTAKKFGLKIDWWIDERRDPVKSTQAAARYLQYLYERFGSWPLALAAYNAGEGRVNNALDKVGESDFWSISATPHIKKETRDYVPSYIAAAAIATHPKASGLAVSTTGSHRNLTKLLSIIPWILML
jgi:membrane-bound lytic murein transglycosylase D